MAGGGEGEGPIDLGIEGLTDAVEVGRGGAATVYRCTQAELGRTVAVKVLRGAVGDPEARIRFQRECLAMGMLSGHPNIVTVYASGFLRDGDPYIVMDYMAGGSLADLVRDHGPLPWAQVLRAGVMIAGALESAHVSGVLHRDVKPENVMRSSYGSARLSDFGIARLQGGPETRSQGLTASILHAAPELLDGKPASVQSDLYAMGSTLYQLLAGAPAFLRDTDETLLPVMARIAHEPLPDLRRAGVPGEVASLVEHLMAKNPSLRPGSAAEAGSNLQRLQQHFGIPVTEMAVQSLSAAEAAALGPAFGPVATLPLPPAPGPPPPGRPPAPVPARGNRTAAVAVGAVLLAVLGLGAVWALTGGGREPTGIVAGSENPVVDTVSPTPTSSSSERAMPTETPSPSPGPTETEAPPPPPPPPPGPGRLIRPLQTDASRSAPPGVDAAGNEVTYDSDNVVDGRIDTAWRTPGHGRRQTVTLIFSRDVRITSIGLVPGYAKVDPADGTDRFFQNRRIRRVRYFFEDGTTVDARFTQRPELQFVELDTVSEYVVVEILRTTAPGDRNYAAISEIEVYGSRRP